MYCDIFWHTDILVIFVNALQVYLFVSCKPVVSCYTTLCCKKVFYDQEEYNEHIRERNKTKNCPRDSELKKKSSPRVRSPSFDRKKVKHEDIIQTPLYKGPPTEITLDDSPPYVAP